MTLRITWANMLANYFSGRRAFTMADMVNMHEAKTHLSELVARAAAGEDIIIARDGKPAAKLVPITDAPRQPGFFKGRIVVQPSFDDPLPEEWFAKWPKQ